MVQPPSQKKVVHPIGNVLTKGAEFQQARANDSCACELVYRQLSKTYLHRVDTEYLDIKLYSCIGNVIDGQVASKAGLRLGCLQTSIFSR